MKPHVVIIIQARMGSTRLPGKVLLKVLGKSFLEYLLERLKRVSLADAIVVATSTNPEDDIIASFCEEQRVACFRGSEQDVLDRYYKAAINQHADVIVRITADCPLMDPSKVEDVIRHFLSQKGEVDYVSNSHTRSLPIGMDVEVFSFKSLKEAALEAVRSDEREHVTPFIYRSDARFKKALLKHEPNLSHIRLTLDTQQDYDLLSLIINELYPKNKEFTMEDILETLKLHPSWLGINAQVKHNDIR